MSLIPPMLTARPQNNPLYASSSSTAGVTQVVAGDASITVSPAGGTGVVTLTVPAGPATFAAGMIMMFNGTTAPDGWAICNGLNGTPDLREKFIYGSSLTVPIGSTGGAASVTLGASNLPQHTHGGVGLSTVSSNNTSGGYSYAATDGVTTGVTGLVTTDPFNIIPPFYALAYIIKT